MPVIRAEKEHSENRYQPMRMQPWYFHLIEVMVASPMMDKKEVAGLLGVSFATVVYVTNSDLFKFHLAERRRDLREQVDAVITQRLVKVADRSLSIIQDILEEKGKALPLDSLSELSHSVLTKLGYGGAPSAPVQVNVNGQANVVVPVSAADLAAARAALRRSEEMRALETATVGGSAVGGSAYGVAAVGPLDPRVDVVDVVEGVEVESNLPPPSDGGVSATGVRSGYVPDTHSTALLPRFEEDEKD